MERLGIESPEAALVSHEPWGEGNGTPHAEPACRVAVGCRSDARAHLHVNAFDELGDLLLRATRKAQAG